MKNAAFVAALSATVLMSAASFAATSNFTVKLEPGQENHGTTLNGHNPSGTAVATYDPATKKLCGKITYLDLTGPAAAMHIHQSPTDPTADGDPKLFIPVAASPVTFNFTLDTVLETALLTGHLYYNIHTAANPDGELRSFTPWDTTTGPDQVCGTPLYNDGGVIGTTTSSSGDAGPTTTSSTSSTSSASSGGTSGVAAGSSGTSSGTSDPAPASSTPPVDDTKKSGCNSTGSPADAISLAFVVGIGLVAAGARVRRKKQR
jgi:hypothetical protein